MPSISSQTLLNNIPFRNFGAKKSKPADLHSISSEKTKVEPSPDPSHQEYLRRIAEEQKRTLPQLFVYATNDEPSLEIVDGIFVLLGRRAKWIAYAFNLNALFRRDRACYLMLPLAIATEQASKKGLLHLLPVFPTPRRSNHSRDAMDLASRNGHVGVLELWKTSASAPLISQPSGKSRCARNGHAEVLEWWKWSGLQLKWRGLALIFAKRNVNETGDKAEIGLIKMKLTRCPLRSNNREGSKLKPCENDNLGWWTALQLRLASERWCYITYFRDLQSPFARNGSEPPLPQPTPKLTLKRQSCLRSGIKQMLPKLMLDNEWEETGTSSHGQGKEKELGQATMLSSTSRWIK
ncbi:hypothetical protein BJ742DRAFT_739441 [Cladochytrium replicatum]|nr:hypothetical protein BJ742DRAFT_739441 [Cladochytrium replicatum]